MRPALVTLLVLLAPLTARAQLSVYFDGNTSTTSKSFSSSGCGTSYTANWALTSTYSACGPLTLWLTSGSCGDAPATGDTQLASVDQSTLALQRTGSISFGTADLPGLGADGGTVCGDVTTRTWRLCAYVELPGYVGYSYSCGSNNQKARSTSCTVNYDGQPPSAPTLTDVSSQDSALRGTVTSIPSDAVEVLLGARRSGSTDSFTLSDRASISGSSVQVTLGGLENNVEYEVVAYAVDAADNVSSASASVMGTPRKTEGFFGQYKAAGGGEPGGCAGAPAAALPVAALLWALQRRRRA